MNTPRLLFVVKVNRFIRSKSGQEPLCVEAPTEAFALGQMMFLETRDGLILK